MAQAEKTQPIATMFAASLLALFLGISSVVGDEEIHKLKLNEIQVLGTQKSYHVAPPAKAYEFLVDVDKLLSTDYSRSADQSHLSLQDQLDKQNIRQLDFDLFWDPHGGLYSKPVGAHMGDFTLFADFVNGTKEVFDSFGDAFEVVGQGFVDGFEIVKNAFRSERQTNTMDQAGFKVMNLNDFDYNTNCQTLGECLNQVKEWSVANPGHIPLTVFLEPKDIQLEKELKKKLTSAIYNFLTSVKILPIAKPPTIGTNELNALEREVLSIFDNSSLILPDMVRGASATLEEAVLTNGWPLLDDVLGKVMFVLESKRDIYVADSPNLAGRVFFTSQASPGQPDAAVISVYNPTSENITALVRQGYMVQTMADTVNLEFSQGWQEAALASGAQFVSTNYPAPQGPTQNINKNYSVSLPVSCNPVLTSETECALFINGAWGEWSDWSTCTGSCGASGTQSRSRKCDDPEPENGGEACSNTVSTTETRTCVAGCLGGEASQISDDHHDDDDDDDDDDDNVVAIVCGVLGGILLLAIIIFFIVRRKRNRKNDSETPLPPVIPVMGCPYCHETNCQCQDKKTQAPPPYSIEPPPVPYYNSAMPLDKANAAFN